MCKKTTIWGILIFLIGFYSNALGGTLSWDASIGEVTGYRVYYSTNSGSLTPKVDVDNAPKVDVGNATKVDVGNVTSCSIDPLPLEEDTLYYFVVTAYNSASESGPSNMVSWTPADTTPPVPLEEFKAVAQ